MSGRFVLNVNIPILAATVLIAGLLLLPKINNAPFWRAAVTPLASIIGSGFLVLGPILNTSYGALAPLVMLALCAAAWGFGAAIRDNIASIARTPRRAPILERLDTLASLSLAFAYTISVAYYLNLFGAFAVAFTTVDDALHARMVTSAVMLLILFVGAGRGLSGLESSQQLSNTIKLAIVAGLLVGLILHFAARAGSDALIVVAPTVGAVDGITLAFGLIITVQGFETSRYLGHRYDATTRVRSMRFAQLLATGIYLGYVTLLTFAFDRDSVALDDTAIIDMMQVVAPVLPVMLVAAALSAQFGAAVADTSGSGGLVEELSKGRITPRVDYALLIGVGLALTWTSNLFAIIGYASRAFAVYYFLQCAIAAIDAQERRQRSVAARHGALAVLALAVVLFGRSVE